MRKVYLLTIVFFVLTLSTVSAQSKSFQALTDRFEDKGEVHAITVSGFLCRSLLWMAGEREFREAISDVSSLSLITIPREYFTETLSLTGYRNLVRADHFESLAQIKDHGDHVEIFLQSGNRKDRYLVLVEEATNLTVIEMRGSMDMKKLKAMEDHTTASVKHD